jgi:hypothetical protein
MRRSVSLASVILALSLAGGCSSSATPTPGSPGAPTPTPSAAATGPTTPVSSPSATPQASPTPVQSSTPTPTPGLVKTATPKPSVKGPTPTPGHGTFVPANGTMTSGRAFASVTRLKNGLVLIAGGLSEDGIDAGTVLHSAEVFDPATSKTHAVGSMHVGRYDHKAVLLNDGRVLVADGQSDEQAGQRSVEIFDPATGIFSTAGNAPWIDWYPCGAVTLKDGRVLFAGGWSIGGFSMPRAVIYNPTTKAWSSISMANAHCTSAQVVLPSGKVLIAGGLLKGAQGDKVTSLVEVFNPTTNTFSTTGSLHFARTGFALTLIASTMVLATGGVASTASNAPFMNSAEVYNPGPATWSAASPMATHRAWHQGTLLTSSKVLITGGWVSMPSNPCASDPPAELFDPNTKTFSNTGKTVKCRSDHDAVRLNTGKVLLVSGGPMIGLHGQDNTMELYWP